jgi:hypothetical protein
VGHGLLCMGTDMMQEMKDHFQYWIGDTVYLKTDKDQCKRMVTGICIRPQGITYALVCGTNESWHYEFEITSDVDVLISTTN